MMLPTDLLEPDIDHDRKISFHTPSLCDRPQLQHFGQPYINQPDAQGLPRYRDLEKRSEQKHIERKP
jgi:hypothetical protein